MDWGSFLLGVGAGVVGTVLGAVVGAVLMLEFSLTKATK